MANKLPLETRVQILTLLTEGNSMRSVSRICDVSINTVAKLLVEAGEACLALHDERVRGVKASRIQCDEIWSFVYAKNKNVKKAKAAPDHAGDAWTWTALDADTKLMVSYFVGDRSGESARVLMYDLVGRLSNRVQLTTDGYKAYLRAVEGAFGDDVDYAILDKIYGTDKGAVVTPERKYSPAECIGAKKEAVTGSPDQKHISTSYVERSNLSIRMMNRRFTRLTNAFSKKFTSHVHALGLYFAFYNFCRIHKSLRVTPAMAAGITDKLWTMKDIVALVDARAPKPGRRKPYDMRKELAR
ncbi:MAG TPA: IS1 family transposase [Hyphomonadaceae bacterium]|nr:IS1 family transposase [Hyphomonadaceae bacterium]